jgi:uncharacterized membrane protein
MASEKKEIDALKIENEELLERVKKSEKAMEEANLNTIKAEEDRARSNTATNEIIDTALNLEKNREWKTIFIIILGLIIIVTIVIITVYYTNILDDYFYKVE